MSTNDKCINIELFPLIFKFNTNPKSFGNIDNLFNLIALISIEFDCEEFIFTEPNQENEKINYINKLLYLITHDQLKKCISNKRSIINNIYELANSLSFNRSLEFVKKIEQFDKIFNNPINKELKQNYFGKFKKEFNLDRLNRFLVNYIQFKNNENELRIKLNLNQHSSQNLNQNLDQNLNQNLNQKIKEQINKFDSLCKIYNLNYFKDKILFIDYELSLNYFKNYYPDYKLDQIDKRLLQNYLNKFTICNLKIKDNFYFTEQDLELILKHFNLIIELINLRNNYSKHSNLPTEQFEQLNYYNYLEANLKNQKANLNEQKYSITGTEYDLQSRNDTKKSIQIFTLKDAIQIEEINNKIKILNKEKQSISKYQKIIIKQINKLHSKLLKEEIKNQLLEDELDQKIVINKLYNLLIDQLDLLLDYIQLIIRSISQRSIKSYFKKRIMKLDEQDLKIDEQKFILNNQLKNLRIKQFELSNQILMKINVIPNKESIEKITKFDTINENLLDDQGLQIRIVIEKQLNKSIEEYTDEYLIFEEIKKKAIKLKELTESNCESENKILHNYEQINLNLEQLFITIQLLSSLLNIQTELSSDQYNLLQSQQEQIILNLKSIKKQLQFINETSQILNEQKQLCLEYLLDKLLFIRRIIVSNYFFQIFYSPPNKQKLNKFYKLQQQLLFILPKLSNDLIKKLPQMSKQLELNLPNQLIYLDQFNNQIKDNKLFEEQILINLIDLKSTIEILKSLSEKKEVQLDNKELSQILLSQQTQILLNLELIYQQLNTICNLSEQFISSIDKQTILKNLNNQLILIRESIDHNLIKMTNSKNKLEELNFFQIQLINNLLSISFKLAINQPNSTDKSQQLLGELNQMLN